ncbi:hypothetical protein EGH67_05915 [Klebsiella aerogenes]|uniref:hypothetical protein n=1 Tax=Klebsiella aerogenes TaxID=548 RepID=UPI00063CBA15|nr:hypothetical protein [Klebsiella aerogenes]EKW1128859.1 hypothetical protein [Klebsiella aerogenes]EKW1133624.1 hypothetical protein [Klebsiella aerogenes]EKZ6149710.1 hypothetical protein [Klebsiella aerogenes]ELA4984594.1 hypothetical protein [Klebsiella aerogenes]KLE83971.1 hypothetical protein YA19_07035 [Klebsiella aerogenes]
MCRDDVIFDLHYSYFLENMFSTLMGRMDKTMSLFLIVLGGTAFAPFSNAFVFGVSVATLSAAQFIFQPGKQEGISSEHAKKYLQLISISDSLDDEILLNRFNELQSLDSRPWGVLKNAAQRRATIALGLHDIQPELTRWESLWSWFAGDLPVKEQYEHQNH